MYDDLPVETMRSYRRVPATHYEHCLLLGSDLRRSCYVRGGFCRCEINPRSVRCDFPGYCKVIGGSSDMHAF